MKKIFAAFSIIFIMTAPTVFAGNTGSVNIEQTTAAGYDYSAAITEDGKLWMWGASFSGYLGFGGTDNVVIPTELMSEVISVYASSENSPPCTAVIKSDGTLWTWGDNYFGRLGDGTQTGRATPQQIMTGVKAASLGFKHTAAIKDDGSLWLWGLNNHGQLGDDTTGNNENPQKIMDHVKAVSAGFWHSAAVTDDGKLWTWGSNIRGQLGDGTNVDSHIPKMVMENVASVQASENFTAAIKTDGTLWMCGSNNTVSSATRMATVPYSRRSSAM